VTQSVPFLYVPGAHPAHVVKGNTAPEQGIQSSARPAAGLYFPSKQLLQTVCCD
jgi:hypothetical protein